MATYKLHKWSVQTKFDPYAAPETNEARLVGYRDLESEAIVTTPMVKVDGKNITTRSGSVYVLQDIDPDYLTWMQSEGIIYDPENPIKNVIKDSN